ncbi:unnamed protein product [Peronospora belbahrii]|uniref:Spen paralogue and orthologue SPOC C-terminal domain-containing protein n=1 Tax=Peronospora belbahrii TaxID=622444 RepID=A0AAU9LP59_9STRA|nr:unnamed protein product [Peronospora belbahrii]CAH0520927.1 unnamed protein product [Peronospora belbahrii]
MIAFTVYKSSKYLFDCVGATDLTQSESYMTVNINALKALGLHAVDVFKRMDSVEVEKLIASCREHPPQIVVMPATHGDIQPFRKFTKYLKARQRAGVVLLADRRLLVLMPLDNDDLRIRCVVISAKSFAKTSTALSSHEANIQVGKAVAETELQAQLLNAMHPPSLTGQRSDKRRRVRMRSHNRVRLQQEEVADTTHQDSLSVKYRHVQAEVAAPTFAPSKDLTMLYSLSRLERATRIAQLRQEYEVFHKLHHEVLQEWSKSNSERQLNNNRPL